MRPRSTYCSVRFIRSPAADLQQKCTWGMSSTQLSSGVAWRGVLCMRLSQGCANYCNRSLSQRQYRAICTMPATAGPAYEAGCATVPAGPPRAGSPCRAGTLGNPAATALAGYLHHRPSAAGTITLPHVGVNGVAWEVHTLPTCDMSSWSRSRQHPACIRTTKDHGMLRHSSASCTQPDGTMRPWLSGRRSRFLVGYNQDPKVSETASKVSSSPGHTSCAVYPLREKLENRSKLDLPCSAIRLTAVAG